MIKVNFKSKFIRQYKKLTKELQIEVKERIDLFKRNPSNQILKIHRLGGRLKGSFSFSVNYQYRIIFEWKEKNKVAVLLSVGDHDIYR